MSADEGPDHDEFHSQQADVDIAMVLARTKELYEWNILEKWISLFEIVETRGLVTNILISYI